MIKKVGKKKSVEIGKRFGKLVVTWDLGLHKQGNGAMRTKVETICDCGVLKHIFYTALKNGSTKSCGCIRKEMAVEKGKATATHFLSKHPLMVVWDCMIQRCYNIKSKVYRNYGGRGVIVCQEWRDNFKPFYDWAIINGWQKGLQLDKDIKGDGLLYSPENCSFVSRIDNNYHRRNNRLITYEGKTMCIAEWAVKLGIRAGTIYNRLFNNKPLSEVLFAGQLDRYTNRKYNKNKQQPIKSTLWKT